MTPRELLDGLRDGNFHVGGIRCLRLMRVHDEYFAALQGEVANLSERERPSDIQKDDHITNWTRPRGEVLQFSLFNLSGRTSDFSGDHDLSSFGKQFHFGAGYPMLARFIETFPDITNFRLNTIGPTARLAPHEENSIIRTKTGSIGACVRYHLPIVTNPGAELTLDGQVFHLEAGIIYLVNHGCVHAVQNGGSERRLHLVWDQLLTCPAYEAVFGDKPDPFWGTRIRAEEQIPSVLRVVRMGAYVRLPSCVDQMAAEQVDLCDPQ